MKEEQSVFKTLSSVDIREKIETKGNVKYLSWSFAWEILKEHYPSAERIVYENPATGLNYFTDGVTAYVKVGVRVEGIENIDYLPIMDFRNQSIRLDKLTLMDVNKAIQRSTAKAIAMHGLGLSLWTGEDVPELTTSAPSSAPAPTSELEELKKDSPNWAKVIQYVEANKTIGIEVIGKQLSRKYKMSPAVKKEIANLVNS